MASPSDNSGIPAMAQPKLGLAQIFAWRKPPMRRWTSGVRAAVAMGLPIMAGWYLGNMPAGMLVSLGGFVAVYGNDRPYLNRSVHLTCLAFAFAAAISLGVATGGSIALAIPAITLIAALSAFLCVVFRVAPPGAYLLALTCAAGTALGAEHLLWWHAGILVLGGGLFAVVVQASGAIFNSRRPEINAVKAAGGAVVNFLLSKPQSSDAARHIAASSLHEAWTVLVGQQPVRPRPDGRLSRLRGELRELHMIFAEAINVAAAGKAIPEQSIARAKQIASQVEQVSDATNSSHIPLGRVSAWQSLREGARPRSLPFEIGLRVAVAAALSGVFGWLLNLEHAYWITASAVLMLYQGLDRTMMFQRAIQRMGGTLIGTLLAGAILYANPHGLWFAFTMMALQFTIELLIMRNYGVAVIFITAAALSIATGGQKVDDIAAIISVRAMDTAIGCLVGVSVFLALAWRISSQTIKHELLRALAAADTVTRLLASGDADSSEARSARRDLQHRTIQLLQAFDNAAGGSDGSRKLAEPYWPAVVATQRLAYRLLAVAWEIEGLPAGAQRSEFAEARFGKDGAQQIHTALAAIVRSLNWGSDLPEMSGIPGFAQVEMDLLRRSIVIAPPAVRGV
jgi:uncharacterized membrane protein YccC